MSCKTCERRFRLIPKAYSSAYDVKFVLSAHFIEKWTKSPFSIDISHLNVPFAARLYCTQQVY